MKIIKTRELVGTDREVFCPNGGFISYRALLEKDGMGFSLSRTVVRKGILNHWHYKNHLEACYCISGKGIIANRATHERFMIVPDSLYVLDEHDDHTFFAVEETVLLCVFNPPVVGAEVHDSDGSYPVPLAH